MPTAAINLLQLLIGLAGGLVVGSGIVAFLVVLDIIPRLAQVTRSYRAIHLYEGAVIAGSVYWTTADFFDWRMTFFPLSVSVVGLCCGVFVGMLAAALTEIVNVLPILAKRLGIRSYMVWLLLAMILGKVIGSLFEWYMF